MSNEVKIYSYKTLPYLARRIKGDLQNCSLILLYAYNGTGKTRLSMTFKEIEKKKPGTRDTLYFNAYTEDLFHWDNDLQYGASYRLLMNADSTFFSGFKDLALEEKIAEHLERYADFNFKVDYENWAVTFSREGAQDIKVSRGEENMFIWCVFLALCQLVLEGHESYSWVKYLYIDDPISSLDDNNAIAVACDLAQLLKRGNGNIKTVLSSHHSLFFNIMWNEFKSSRAKYKTYFYHRNAHDGMYTLRCTSETPFLHHVSLLSELQEAVDKNQIYTSHFNMLRNVLEKTATFFGYKDFSACICGVDDEVLYARALNLLSHGKYSMYEPREMVEDNKQLFKKILFSFLERYHFALPDLSPKKNKKAKLA